MDTLLIFAARFIVGPIVGILAGLIVAGLFVFNSPEIIHLPVPVFLVYFLIFAIGGIAVLWNFGD